MISYGTAAFLKEPLMDISGASSMHVGDICGLAAIADLKN